MAKYSALGPYLRSRGDAVPMTFTEFERVVGAPLPPRALRHRSWWSNNSDNNVATREWVAAGYQTEQVDLANKRLVFKRVAPRIAEPTAVAWPERGSEVAQTELEAPEMETEIQDPLFGCMKGTVYLPPGEDLIAPALDADWEEKWLAKWDEELARPGWEKLKPKKDE